MQPDHPHTGYGYLELDSKRKQANGITVFRVKSFREKPNLSQAKQFLKRGNYLWNGGTFIWRFDAFKKAVEKHFPKLYPAFKSLSKKLSTQKLLSIYKKLPSISLDYAVMEKMKNVHCLKVPFQWKDVGGWPSLSEFWKEDSKGNRMKGQGLLIRSQGNIVKSDKRLIALLGVKDLIVIDTPDALLISSRAESEKIREIVHELEKKRSYEYL